ncbi:MAG: alpha/beta hydrolase [Betaproteobacteria bacterium]|nr:alpha/beta hydrolase [Betaproteobacteria bacterium]
MELLSHIELVTGAEPQGTVIWMHGLGADGWDFVPIVRELDLPENLSLRFIFPNAPVRPVTINNGYAMRAWYDIAMADIGRLPDETGIRQSQAQVEAFLAREKSRGIAASRIVLAGFSQGGAIALHTALRHTEPLAGILALSTYLPLGETLDRELADANDHVAIFMAHGTQDPVVPFALAESSRAALVSRGLSPEWHAYPMPHSVCAEEVAAISRWLVARYASPILTA